MAIWIKTADFSNDVNITSFVSGALWWNCQYPLKVSLEQSTTGCKSIWSDSLNDV